jgi:hypothetical protein
MMNVPFKHFFNACQPEFKSLHGVSWEEKPQLYYQYLQTRYLALIAESLGPGMPAPEGLKASAPANAAGHEEDEEEIKPAPKQGKEHIET